MYRFPIGIIIDCFKEDFGSALKKCTQIGAKGIQMYATYGEHSPRNLNAVKRKELLDMVKSNGLCFSAICGDLGQGFTDPAKNPTLIEDSKRIIDLAKDLETNIVTTHIGVVPADKNHDRYKVMQEACFELANYADSIDAHFAVETGPERAIVLKEFLDTLNSRGVSVNLDPANLVMVTGDDPVQAVYTLKDYIVHTHAKDGVKLLDKDPEIIYGMVEEEIKTGAAFHEEPLGQGRVDFDNYLKALYDIGYRGFLTIEREVGEDVAGDIRTAYNFLTDKMANL
ncbi:MAG: sugar phosphate isomerase/epimerase [Ruminococcaceae bacterium]|nr:sugar phosphate isomerase/epimerase [Oscillospiraceae bacterium]